MDLNSKQIKKTQIIDEESSIEHQMTPDVESMADNIIPQQSNNIIEDMYISTWCCQQQSAIYLLSLLTPTKIISFEVDPKVKIQQKIYCIKGRSKGNFLENGITLSPGDYYIYAIPENPSSLIDIKGARIRIIMNSNMMLSTMQLLCSLIRQLGYEPGQLMNHPNRSLDKSVPIHKQLEKSILNKIESSEEKFMEKLDIILMTQMKMDSKFLEVNDKIAELSSKTSVAAEISTRIIKDPIPIQIVEDSISIQTVKEANSVEMMPQNDDLLKKNRELVKENNELKIKCDEKSLIIQQLENENKLYYNKLFEAEDRIDQLTEELKRICQKSFESV